MGFPSFDIGPADLSKAWDWFTTISPVRQVMIATVAIAILMFIACHRSKKKALEKKDKAIAGLIAEKDATIQRQQAEISEKNATIERRQAEISTIAQRLKQRDEELATATKSMTVVPGIGARAPELLPPQIIGTAQQLRAHRGRVVRLWDQAAEHRNLTGDGFAQAVTDWDRLLDSKNPLGSLALMVGLFPRMTTPEEDLQASGRQLQGLASDFRGTLALLSQALNFDLAGA